MPKLAQVVELLQRDRSATIDELVKATGWLPHTSRVRLWVLGQPKWSRPLAAVLNWSGLMIIRVLAASRSPPARTASTRGDPTQIDRIAESPLDSVLEGSEVFRFFQFNDKPPCQPRECKSPRT
jgi:hypothetical protein